MSFNDSIITEFRANEGRVGGPFQGMPLLLLTHTGAKTGTKRTNPLAYLEDDGRYVIFASKGGAPTNPDWYHNLRANPDVTVEVGTDTFAARARVAEGAERDELYARQAELRPQFAEYAQKTTRVIPVVVLERT
ncbi:MAG: nitroreductase family deazaflavin-dependent oxidoreductase [Actinobacteria bacterium]|nr:nitroreductase family deazaflavin-dependent oxidoreductase [Actinomycetota bacterium]